MTKDCVSIIILTFNSEEYIDRAIKSVKSQSYTNFEVVVVDAGSKDNTHDIVLQHTGVKLLILQNSDMGMARNYGVANSSGEFIMFLDSDDFYMPKKLEIQVKEMRKRIDLEVLYSQAYIYYANNKNKIGIKSATDRTLTLKDYLNGNCYTLGTACIRRSVWNKYRLTFGEGDNGRYCEDWSLQLDIACKDIIYDVIQTPLVAVEIRENSHTTWDKQHVMKRVAIDNLEKALDLISISKVDITERKKLVDRYRLKLAISYLTIGDPKHARAYLKNIVKSKEYSRIFKAAIFVAMLNLQCSRYLVRLIWKRRQISTFNWLEFTENPLTNSLEP